MYIHLGDGNIIKVKDIIGIFDIKSIESSRENKRIQYILESQKLKGKSVILLQDGKDYKEITSKISADTLKKRIERGIF